MQLNLESIVAVALESARTTADIVGTALQLIEQAGADAVGTHSSKFATYEFGPPSGSPASRYEARRRWLLVRGFQDITLATRRACEQADMILSVAAEPVLMTTPMDFGERLKNVRRKANETNLPQLIERIVDAVGEPLSFSRDLLSLNAARNCLEHRAGRVSAKDLDKDSDRLCVSYPRMRFFYVYEGKEIELQLPCELPDAPQGTRLPILMQRTQRVIEFRVGDQIDFSSHDFAEIAFAVWFFATDLSGKVSGCPRISALPRTAHG